MKLNQFLTLNGYFFKGEYYEYDLKLQTWKEPILIRFKQNDAGIQGVSSGGKKIDMEQTMQGAQRYKNSINIKVADNLPYKPNDMFKILNEDKKYIIKQVFEDYSSVNTINNLQFSKMRDNREYVLVMGEQ